MYSETRVWALATHPGRLDEILAGTDSGIYRLDVAGGKWTHLPSQMDDLCVWSVTRSPHDPDLILAGTRPPAMFRSIDGAKTWRRVEAPLPETCPAVMRPRVTKIQFDPDDPDLVWAGLEIGGVWRSTDGGKSFQSASRGLVSDDIHDINVVRNGARLVYATTNQGLHVSRDDGLSWEMKPLDSAAQYTRGITPRADGSGFVLLGNGDGPPGSWGKLMRSRDYGANWEDAGLPGEPKDLAEPEPSADADRFGREERLEQALLNFRRHSIRSTFKHKIQAPLINKDMCISFGFPMLNDLL